MIPNISVYPTLEEIQEVLILAGKHISGLSKGVAQWSGGKSTKVVLIIISTHFKIYSWMVFNKSMIFIYIFCVVSYML